MWEYRLRKQSKKVDYKKLYEADMNFCLRHMKAERVFENEAFKDIVYRKF